MYFVNISNHPVDKWNGSQREAAERYGFEEEAPFVYSCAPREIVDIPFPAVPPSANEREIAEMAEEVVSKVESISPDPEGQVVVHIMGEMGLTFAVVSRLKSREIEAVHSTTARFSMETEEGQKVSAFRFLKFREY